MVVIAGQFFIMGELPAHRADMQFLAAYLHFLDAPIFHYGLAEKGLGV